MTGKFRNWIPIGMALFTVGVSFLVYSSPGNSGQTVTAVLAACAALGWSAIVLFHPANRRRLILHLAVALTLPLVARCLSGVFAWDPLWHWVIYAMLLVSFTGLLLFVGSQSRPRKSTEKR